MINLLFLFLKLKKHKIDLQKILKGNFISINFDMKG